MKTIFRIAIILLLPIFMTGCFNLEEKMYDRINAADFYQNERSIQSSIAAIYDKAAHSYHEYFFYLQEFSADQVAWRSWNGGGWGYDEGDKFVISTQSWTPEATIIRQAWENAWMTIGMCNQLLVDISKLNATDLGMTDEKLQAYVSEIRTLRAWAYYNIYEIWGGALPLNTGASSADTPLPPSASAANGFEDGCRVIYNFICQELDESYPNLPLETGDNATRNRMNQGVNRILKARMLLNANIFIGEEHFEECEILCKEIIKGTYGTYSLAQDYRDIYSLTNTSCPEVVFAMPEEVGHLNTGWMRDMPFLPYNYQEYFGASYDQSGWNCVILTPSWDNSGNKRPNGGTSNPRSFLTYYGDKLGAVYERFDDRDIRKQNYVVKEDGSYEGIFLIGEMRANFGKGATIKADAERDGEPLVYVDQVGTFLNRGRNLEDVMSPRWGETNSGVRLVRYPIMPEQMGQDFQNIDEVEFRMAEVYYMVAECEMRKGNSGVAKNYVDEVRKRYFTDQSALSIPGPGFTAFDMDWMLSEWGKEYISEGRRRRTDLRRFDKFTQGQWWFFGRAMENGVQLPAKRESKYEWFPLPSTALTVNPGLKQNPNY